MKNDTASITGSDFLRKPRAIAVFIFFYVFIVLFRACLVSIIRINAATIGNFDVHCWAMEMLYHTALLNFKDRQ